MKDKHDTQTQDLIPSKRGRGRPATGKALSAAEKQARYRARKAQDTVTVTFNRSDIGALKLIVSNSRNHFPELSDETLDRIIQAVFDQSMNQGSYGLEGVI